MKRNVCKEITSMDLSYKTVASFQPNLYPRRYNLKLQAKKIFFENCSAQQCFKNPWRNLFQSSSLLAIRTFFWIWYAIEMSLHCFKKLFLYFNNIEWSFPMPKFNKNRDTVPLNLSTMLFLILGMVKSFGRWWRRRDRGYPKGCQFDTWRGVWCRSRRRRLGQEWWSRPNAC